MVSEDIRFLFVMTILISLFTGFIVGIFYLNDKYIIEPNQEIRDGYCKEMGLIEYTYRNGFDFCEDKEKNLNYIDMDCKMKISGRIKSCSYKLIKVGEVWGTSNGE